MVNSKSGLGRLSSDGFKVSLWDVLEDVEKRATGGERRLIREVMRRAVRDLESDNTSDRRSAVKWFLTVENGVKHSFSFEWCCHWLDIDSERARGIVLCSGMLD